MTAPEPWRAGSKTGVTLFRGDEIWGMLLTPEKAVAVARWLNWGDMAQGGTSWLERVSDAQLRVILNAVMYEEGRRGRPA